MTNFFVHITHGIIQKVFKVSIIKHFPRYSEELILSKLKGDLVGVEIGTSCGENARRMLKVLPLKTLYLIDPYLPYYEIPNGMEKSKARCYKILKRWNNKIIRIEKKSNDAVKDIPDNLDFVYIDGGHDYQSVKDDINNYYPKLKKGGLLTGHDFNIPDVARVVIEFSDKIKKPILWKCGDIDWGIEKE